MAIFTVWCEGRSVVLKKKGLFFISTQVVICRHNSRANTPRPCFCSVLLQYLHSRPTLPLHLKPNRLRCKSHYLSFLIADFQFFGYKLILAQTNIIEIKFLLKSDRSWFATRSKLRLNLEKTTFFS